MATEESNPDYTKYATDELEKMLKQTSDPVRLRQITEELTRRYAEHYKNVRPPTTGNPANSTSHANPSASSQPGQTGSPTKSSATPGVFKKCPNPGCEAETEVDVFRCASCGKLFCYMCIRYTFLLSSTCPHCEQKLGSNRNKVGVISH